MGVNEKHEMNRNRASEEDRHVLRISSMPVVPSTMQYPMHMLKCLLTCCLGLRLAGEFIYKVPAHAASFYRFGDRHAQTVDRSVDRWLGGSL